MTAYSVKTLLPFANGETVCEELIQWLKQLGYAQVSRRPLFDCGFGAEERRIIVIWNSRWTIILYSHDHEEAPALRRALSHFSSVLQVGQGDGGWGYHYEENGIPVALFQSKPALAGIKRVCDRRRLCAACGIPGKEEALRRIERPRLLLTGKSLRSFCALFQAPVASLDFFDLDQVNQGILEVRHIGDWQMRQIFFERAQAHPSPSSEDVMRFVMDDLNSQITGEEKVQIEKAVRKIRWITRLLSPVVFILSALATVFIGVIVLATNLSCCRRLFLGKGALQADQFIKQVKLAEKALVRIEGNCLINTRHGCRVQVSPGATPLPDHLPSVGRPFEHQVFAFEAGNAYVSCHAHQLSRRVSIRGTQSVTEKQMMAGTIPVTFQKRHVKAGRREWFSYRWQLKTSEAHYEFSCSGCELSAREENLISQVVESFKTDRP